MHLPPVEACSVDGLKDNRFVLGLWPTLIAYRPHRMMHSRHACHASPPPRLPFIRALPCHTNLMQGATTIERHHTGVLRTHSAPDVSTRKNIHACMHVCFSQPVHAFGTILLTSVTSVQQSPIATGAHIRPFCSSLFRPPAHTNTRETHCCSPLLSRLKNVS